MIKRFCDICEQELIPDDTVPYQRQHGSHPVQIALIVTDTQGNVANDICNSCKRDIVNEGLTLAEVAAAPPQKITPIERPPMIKLHGGVGSGGTKPATDTDLKPLEPSLKQKKPTTAEKEPAKK